MGRLSNNRRDAKKSFRLYSLLFPILIRLLINKMVFVKNAATTKKKPVMILASGSSLRLYICKISVPMIKDTENDIIDVFMSRCAS